MILVHFDDIAAHATGDLAQLAFLIGGGLVQGRDAKVKNCSFHELCSQIMTIQSIFAVRKSNLFFVRQLSGREMRWFY